MSSLEVRGVVLPMLTVGWPAMDFLNSRAGWGEPVPKEYLTSYRHLAVFAGHLGLLGPHAVAALEIRDSAAVLRRALRLRDAVYALITSDQLTAWPVVQREVELAAPLVRLAPGRPATLAVTGESDSLALPLHAIAWSVGQLVSSPQFAQARACAGRNCGWVYFDPRGNRRWCTMAICGNRNKARRFAARQAAGQTGRRPAASQDAGRASTGGPRGGDISATAR